ncbi:hypothetical protein ACOMHN_027846 [Nucella lapillus]
MKKATVSNNRTRVRKAQEQEEYFVVKQNVRRSTKEDQHNHMEKQTKKKRLTRETRGTCTPPGRCQESSATRKDL